VKPVDKALPKLMLAGATSRHIPQCVLAVRRAPGRDVMVLTLMDCVVTSIAGSGSREAGTMLETITLGFSSIVFQERPQKPDGSFDTPVTAGWNIKVNAPI
jgi:type VI protein secretion system component Hcp